MTGRIRVRLPKFGSADLTALSSAANLRGLEIAVTQSLTADEPLLVLVRSAYDAVCDALESGEPLADAITNWAEAAEQAAEVAKTANGRLANMAEAEFIPEVVLAALLSEPRPSEQCKVPEDALVSTLAYLAVESSDRARSAAKSLASLPGGSRPSVNLEAAASALVAARCRANAWVEHDEPDCKTALQSLRAERDLMASQLAGVQDRLEALLVEAPPIGQIVLLDETSNHPAFHQVERIDPSRPFRWLGRQPTAMFATNVARRHAVRVEVMIESAITEAARDGLSILMDGEESQKVETVFLQNGRYLKAAEFGGDPTAPAAGRRNLVLVQHGSVDMTEKGDARTLGCAISRISIEPIECSERAVKRHKTVLAFDARPGRNKFGALETLRDGTPYRRLSAGSSARVSIDVPPTDRVRLQAHCLSGTTRDAADKLSISVTGLAFGSARTKLLAKGGFVRAIDVMNPARLGRMSVTLDLSGDDGDAALARLVALDASEHAVRARPATRTLSAEHHLVHPAFHGLERRPGDGQPFRWMGRESFADLTITMPLDRTIQVETHVFTAINEQAFEGLTIAVEDHDGDAYSVSELADGTIVRSAIFPFADSNRALPETVNVRLGLRHTVDLSHRGDPRTVGVAVMSVVIRQLDAD